MSSKIHQLPSKLALTDPLQTSYPSKGTRKFLYNNAIKVISLHRTNPPKHPVNLLSSKDFHPDRKKNINSLSIPSSAIKKARGKVLKSADAFSGREYVPQTFHTQNFTSRILFVIFPIQLDSNLWIYSREIAETFFKNLRVKKSLQLFVVKW